MPPHKAFHLPQRLLTTAARLGRPRISLKFRKRVTQNAEDASTNTTATGSHSTPAPSSSSALSFPANFADVIAETTDVAPSNRKSREVAKEALLLLLQGLVASADAFPPLKSAVGGLSFVVDQLVSSNKTQVLDVYARIRIIAESIARAMPVDDTPSPAHEAALRALTSEIEAVCITLRDITHERKHFVKRYICAKLHRAQLQDIVRRLDNADAAFMRTMTSSAEANGAKALDYLRNKPCEACERGSGAGNLFFLVGRPP
ncbi:unnamed protein product [Peniophora sp. CBMAI 1063]|nr:unnamed protein product [Peniophora sp. CBMAI 1063]